ncbi:MAG: hypothetical protein JNM18_21310, partial [Planctomycetaceae bacterium]|nr:hypothetical protein [Planctomycetaceae bacterium]
WMNRGFDWREIVDQPGRFEITLSVDYPGIEYPVTTDVTLWRLQQFRVPAGDKVRWSAGTTRGDSVTIDEHGGLHVGRITFPSREPLRLIVERSER